MKDRYHIDLDNYSLEKFLRSLERRNLIPSRVMLKEDIQARFNILDSHGISTLKTLIDTLKSKQHIAGFSKKTGLPVEYLTILRREAASYLPKPVRLRSFPGIDPKTIELLEKRGVRNTKQFFHEVGRGQNIGRIAQEANIPVKGLGELASLSDLARLYGVGPAFARILFDIGIDSVESFVGHAPEEIISIYEEKTKKKADFSRGDIEFSIDLAKELPNAEKA